jgi:hypothetical protein
MSKQAIIILEQHLKNAPYGSRFDFTELSAIAQTDILKHRSVIACVNRHLRRHHGRILQSVRGYGYTITHPELEPLNLPAGKKNYMISSASILADPENPRDRGILITFRELKEDVLEDRAMGRAIPTDTAIINYLLSKGSLD